MNNNNMDFVAPPPSIHQTIHSNRINKMSSAKTTAVPAVTATKTKTLDTFECTICYDTCKDNKRTTKITCRECSYVVCKPCQKRYAKPECSNCHTTFPRTILHDILGVSFIKNTIIKEKIDELLIKEKKMIANTAPLIEYFRRLKEANRQRAYGKKVEVPDRPVISLAASASNYPCTKDNCRGYLRPNAPISSDGNKSACCLCNIVHCNICQMPAKNAVETVEINAVENAPENVHVCDPVVLESLREISMSAKRCPTCFVFMHRTHGCNHMNCAVCGTHFDWITGIPMGDRTRGLGGPNKIIENKKGTMQQQMVDVEKNSAAVNETPDEIRTRTQQLETFELWFMRDAKKKLKPDLENMKSHRIADEIEDEKDLPSQKPPPPKKQKTPEVIEIDIDPPATEVSAAESAAAATERGVSTEEDVVYKQFIHLFYTIPYFVIGYYRVNTPTPQEYCNTVDDMRVQFMNNLINERAWGSKLYLAYRKYQISTRMHDILVDFIRELGILRYRDLSRADRKIPPAMNWPHLCEQAIEMVHKTNERLRIMHDDFYEMATSVSQLYIDLDYQITDEESMVDAIPAFTSRFRNLPSIHFDNTDPETPENKKQNAHDSQDTQASETQESLEGAHDGIHDGNVKEPRDWVRPQKQIVPVNLWDYQAPHYAKIKQVLSKNHYIVDHSPLGAGKTKTTIQYLIEHPFDVVYVFCPNALTTKWKRELRGHGITALVTSYTQLGGVLNRHPNHGLLARYDYTKHTKTGGISNHVKYTTTAEFRDIVQSARACCIFDEIQDIRDPTSNVSKAARKIIHTIIHSIRSNANMTNRDLAKEHKLFFLSGTPFDCNVKNIPTFLGHLNVITRNLFEFNPHTKTNEAEGFLEAIHYFQLITPVHEHTGKMDELFVAAADSRTATEGAPIVYELFLNCVIPQFGSAMKPPKKTILPDGTELNLAIHKIDTYCHLTGADLELYNHILSKSIDIIAAHDSGEVVKDNAKIFELLMMEQSCLVSSVVSMVDTLLTNDPKCKVVIAATYVEVVNNFFKQLQAWTPELMVGGIDVSMRDRIIDAFQEPSSACRLIIGNITILSTGIDLDDRYGDYKRYAFVLPTFCAMDSYQFNFRFLRGCLSRSSTVVRYVYSDHCLSPEDKEQAVLRKGEFCPTRYERGSDNENVEARLFNIVSRKNKIIGKLDVDADRLVQSSECVYL